MELTLREFVAKDVEVLWKDAIEESLHEDFDQVFSMAVKNERNGPGFTGVLGTKILGAGGINLVPDGPHTDGRIWLILHKDAKEFKKSILRIFFTMFPLTAKNYKLRYVYAHCSKEFKSARRLIRHMKFEQIAEDDQSYYYRIDARNLVPYGVKTYTKVEE